MNDYIRRPSQVLPKRPAAPDRRLEIPVHFKIALDGTITECKERAAPQRWGRRLDSNRCEGRTSHLLNLDNSPRCGVKYFATPGTAELDATNKCRRCLAMRPPESMSISTTLSGEGKAR